jgi:chromosome segregation ATPase
MTTGIKDSVSQLAEINRALLEDLDLSRQRLAQYGSERDSLKAQVDELNQELRRLRSVRTEGQGPAQQQADRLRTALVKAEREIETLTEEREAMGRDLCESRRWAELAEQKLHALAIEYVAMEEQKNYFERQVHELNDAMEDIRYSLLHPFQPKGQDEYLF